MNKIKHQAREEFKLTARLRALRSDQGGSVTLLAGMMVFLGTVFAILAFDTNMAIYNRIISQNAVDSAADAAALWQARGCNMLQLLNNLHYDVDTAACIGETVADAACVASDGLLAAETAAEASVLLIETVPAIAAARTVSCTVCDTLPYIDVYQNMFYNAIMPVQQAIVDVTPFLAFAYANACAKGSGADELLTSVLGSAQNIISQLGIAAPSFTSIAGGITGGLGSIPVYAAPLDPSSLSLYVTRRDNDGSAPLAWPSWVGEAGEITGYIGCSEETGIAVPLYPSPLIGPPFFGYFDDADEFHSDYEKQNDDQDWGWNDQYFFGHPGFMTWIAGKAKRDELLGLGNLEWLNGQLGNQDAMTQALYTGDTSTTGAPLEIPAFVAIASSQVEGTPVVCDTDDSGVNAVGKIIKVYFPSGTEGETYWIYH